MKKKKIIQESGFARINRILQGDISKISSYGIVTGENPCGCELDKKDNTEMNQRLLTMIRAKGYGFHKIGGNFFFNEENSFLIPNITEDELIALGVRLKQYSVIYGSKNVTPKGRVYMRHHMLRTYCDEPCKKTSNWDTSSLNIKLRGLKPLTKADIGSVENVRNVSLSGKDTQAKITDFSYTKKGNRKFSIPFYDDPKSSAYPSSEYGKNIEPYRYDLSDDQELSIEDKFGFTDIGNSEDDDRKDESKNVYKNKNKSNMKKIVRVTENDLTKIVRKVIKEQDGDENGRHISVTGIPMDMLPNLSDSNALSITANGCGLNTMPPFEHLPKSLTVLKLENNDITEADMEGYRNLPDLLVIGLEDNPIQWVNWEEVGEMKNLARLSGVEDAENYNEKSGCVYC